MTTSPSSISDAAVHAALNVLPYQAADYVDMDYMRFALEAAAPYMQAQAWDQGYDRAESDHDGTGFWTKRLRGNPYMLNNEGEK